MIQDPLNAISHFVQVIRRKVVVPADNDFEQPFKVTLNKKNKKDGMLLLIPFKC